MIVEVIIVNLPESDKLMVKVLREISRDYSDLQRDKLVSVTPLAVMGLRSNPDDPAHPFQIQFYLSSWGIKCY